MADEARSRLGRGLASLIGDVGGEAAHVDRPRNPRKVPIEFLKPNPRNPRRTFSDAELGELASSVKQHGVIQPIVVRPVKGAQDRYEIIAGERRWRAAQLAGLHEVPIVPVDVSDSDALEIAPSAACPSSFSRPIHVTRAAAFPKPSLTNWRHRSSSTA